MDAGTFLDAFSVPDASRPKSRPCRGFWLPVSVFARLSGVRGSGAFAALLVLTGIASAKPRVGEGKYMCQLVVNGRAAPEYPCDVVYADWANSQDGGLYLRYPIDADVHRLETEIRFGSKIFTLHGGTWEVPEAERTEEDYGVHTIYSELRPVKGGWSGRLEFTSFCAGDVRCSWKVELRIKRKPWPKGFKSKMWPG